MTSITGGFEIDVNDQFDAAMESLSSAASVLSGSSDSLSKIPSSNIKKIAAKINKQEKKKNNKNSRKKLATTPVSKSIGTSSKKTKAQNKNLTKKNSNTATISRPNGIRTENSAASPVPEIRAEQSTTSAAVQHRLDPPSNPISSAFQSSMGANNDDSYGFPDFSRNSVPVNSAPAHTNTTIGDILNQNFDYQRLGDVNPYVPFLTSTSAADYIDASQNHNAPPNMTYQQLNSAPQQGNRKYPHVFTNFMENILPNFIKTLSILPHFSNSISFIFTSCMHR